MQPAIANTNGPGMANWLAPISKPIHQHNRQPFFLEDTDHPAMDVFKGMTTYTTTDEWYSFTSNPRPQVHVLAHPDESSIKQTNKENNWQMGDHPLIWYQEINGMRSFYTGFGHTVEAYQNSKIRAHIAGAVNWAGHIVE